jgi:hypothetical protein
MSLFKIFKNVAGLDKDKPKVGIDRNDHPLDLHPGSLVTIPDIDLTLAQADGSLVPNVEITQTVTAVSKFKIFDLDVYHSYLSDEKSFIRTVADGLHIKEVTFFVQHDEVLPQTQDDWNFWLGTYNANGPVEGGLIGWPQFQIDKPTPTVYDRSWKLGDSAIKPVEFFETIVDTADKNTYIKNQAMEYNRKLSEDTYEYLLVTLAQCGNEASVDIYVGVPLNAANIKVLAV